MKMRNSKKLLWIAFVAIAAVSAFPRRGAADGCGQVCIGLGTECSHCMPSPVSFRGCVELAPCSCVTVTCDPPAAKASADAALALLLTPPDTQTGGRCTLQGPAFLGD